jgi:hypothetical protein
MSDGTLQGTAVDGGDEAALRRAIELAFDYRGDVTIALRPGAGAAGGQVVGYVFDRRLLESAAESFIRVIPADGSPRVTIHLPEIASLSFTGRDTAAGKSFETWVKKYIEKKRAGQSASIESEAL